MGKTINQATFTFQFFYSVFRQVIGGTITTNDTTNDQMADDIRQKYNNMDPTPAQIQRFEVNKVHRRNGYTGIISSILQQNMTAFVNGIEGDTTQWMANLFCLQVRKQLQQYQPAQPPSQQRE